MSRRKFWKRRSCHIQFSVIKGTCTSKNIQEHLGKQSESDASVIPDQCWVYDRAGKHCASQEMVDHPPDAFVRGDVNANTAEGFFNQLKRLPDGTHHHDSRKHLLRCMAEFDFRYNARIGSG